MASIAQPRHPSYSNWMGIVASPVLRDLPMMTTAAVLNYVNAARFRPFQIPMATGQTFAIRHPKLIKVLKSHLLVLSFDYHTPDVSDAWQSVSLMLAESISHLEAPVA